MAKSTISINLPKKTHFSQLREGSLTAKGEKPAAEDTEVTQTGCSKQDKTRFGFWFGLGVFLR